MSAWKKRARSAAEKLRSAKRGETESILSTVGRGVNPNTVRREIQALMFLEKLRNTAPLLARSLQSTSFCAVELLARWSSFDARGAAAAARKVAQNEYPLKSLRSAMQQAMQRHAVPTRSGVLRSIETAVRRQIGEVLNGDLIAMEAPATLIKVPIDFHFKLVRPGFEPEQVAAMLVGPFKYAGQYSKRRQEELWRAMGFAWVFDHVVVILPSQGDLLEYRAWLAEFARSPPLRRTAGRNITQLFPLSIHIIQIENL